MTLKGASKSTVPDRPTGSISSGHLQADMACFFWRGRLTVRFRLARQRKDWLNRSFHRVQRIVEGDIGNDSAVGNDRALLDPSENFSD